MFGIVSSLVDTIAWRERTSVNKKGKNSDSRLRPRVRPMTSRE